jgi:hypothetical protein
MESAPPKTKKQNGFIVPLGVAAGAVFMGADFAAISLGPLEYLGIPFSPVLRYAHFVAPAVAFTLWFFTRRSATLSAVLFVLTLTLVPTASMWADVRTVNIRITKWIDDIPQLEGRLGFKVFETGDANGVELRVDRTPGRALALTAEVKRLGILRP